MSNKPFLRQHYLSLKKNLSSEYRHTASNLAAVKILNNSTIQVSNNICIYISLPLELDTHALIKTFLSTQKKLYAPVVFHQTIKLRQLTNLEDCLPGEKNILEPPDYQPEIDPNQIDAFIVPGLSFDTSGYRLGYGKGYYDRLLALSSGFRLGVAFTDQLTYELPHEPHDIRMHHLITDSISFPTFPFKKK